MIRHLWWTTKEYKYVDDSTIGSPIISKDTTTGDITNYEYTNTPVSMSGNTSENTGFTPFDGKDFRITLKVKLGSGNNNYATLLHALWQNSSGDYEGFIVRYQGITVLSASWRLIIGSSVYSLGVSSGDTVTFKFEYINGQLKSYVNNSLLRTDNLNLNADSINLWIGSDSGSGHKVKAEIYEFKVEKL